MPVATPTQAPTPTPPSEPPYPWRVGLVMVALVLVLGAAFFFATKVLNGPAIDDRSVAPTEIAIAVRGRRHRGSNADAGARDVGHRPATGTARHSRTESSRHADGSGCPGCRTNASADRAATAATPAPTAASRGIARAVPIPVSGPISIETPRPARP